MQAVGIGGDIIVRMIDELPVLGVAAAYANGQTSVSQAEELRNKESDRIAVLCSQLLDLKIDVIEMSDGFRINGGKLPSGGKVLAKGDHRIAMAMAILGLAAQKKTTIEGAEIISESFPNFFDTLKSLGANLEYA